MQLSKFSDYSFRALIYLAQHQERLCTVDELSQNLKTSEHHMKKVIHQLAQTDYMTSIKGRGGGLKLAMAPSDINLGEVLRLTETNLDLVECLTPSGTCPLMSSGCRLKKISSLALERFMEEFSRYTLADLLEE